MASTTLMTFLLRTPPNVRSVELLGSWDNFNRPYPMEQDKRVGAGHWRGCHTFTDIICDGNPQSRSPGRSGGLKMGGTYWYYYRLDGDIEYYNDAEPVTTHCPLLPGQPVNVLHVPIILPDTNGIRKRDASVSSQQSDRRTMDPKDKYMNPRTPPRPKLPRLKTSPPLDQQPDSSWSSFINFSMSANENRSVSQPGSSTSSPRFRLVQKFKISRSVSPPRSRGLRAAFMNMTGARSPGVDPDEHHRGRSVGRQNGVDTALSRHDDHQFGSWLRVPGSKNSSNYDPRVTSPEESLSNGLGIGKLPFRQPVFDREDNHQKPSIQSRRASKSSSRDNSPLRSYLILDSSSGESNFSGVSGFSCTRRLDTLKEASSQQNTPMIALSSKPHSPVPGMTTPTPLGSTEKRLPTLPNSPSSVMDEELRAMDAQNRALDMEFLRSHFSDYTSTAGSEVYDDSPLEKSRFSEWSTDTELVSPVSMTSSCTFNNSDRPHHSPSSDTVTRPTASKPGFPASSGPATPTLSSVPQILPPTTVASNSPALPPSTGPLDDIRFPDNDLDFSTLCIDDFDHVVENNPKRHAGVFTSLEALASLSVSPSDRSAPGEARSRQSNGLLDTPNALDGKDTGSDRQSVRCVSQSGPMPELMDELGYLGDMIQVGV
ncbi:hypothetical protein VTN77DRAFT_8026 [Rasamsonia byssochlamydoides]|uniref:uncharacterized protein n=1 Tax=Rasamsonia byssochlamydoides TaxID=89139 RepID=UPI003743E37B